MPERGRRALPAITPSRRGDAMTDITACHDLARPRHHGGENPHALARRRPGFGIPVPPHCREMIRRGALVAVNSSGGKDSQCMTILLSRIRPPRADCRRSRPARRGRVARHGRAYREHASPRRAAHPRPRHLRQVAARQHRGTGPVPVGIDSMVYELDEARTHRARAAALSQSPSPIRREAGERHGHARGREGAVTVTGWCQLRVASSFLL